MVQEQRHKIPEPVTYTQYISEGGKSTHPPPNCNSDNNTIDTTLNNDRNKNFSNNTFLNRFTCKRNSRRNSKNLKSVLLRTVSNQSFNNFGLQIPKLPTSMFENRRMSLPSKPFDYALEYFRQQSTRISTDGGGGARRHSFAQFDAVVPTTTRKRVRAESECNPIRKNSLLDTNSSDLAKKHKTRLDFSERLCLQKHEGNLSYSVLSASISQVCDQKINFGTQWPFDSKLNSFIKQNEKTPLTSLTLAIINHHNRASQPGTSSGTAYFSGKDMLKIQNLMLKIEKAYQNCEYHNSIHACDVLTATEVLMNQVEIRKNLKFSLEERFSTLLAAACHDVGHPGVTSEHIYKFYKPKRIQRLFYDETVEDERGHAGMLERFHVSLSYAYLEHADLDCLKSESDSMFEIGGENDSKNDSETETENKNDDPPIFNRNSFIENFQKCILATDMTKHKNAIDSLKTLNLNKKSSSKNLSEHSNAELLPIIVHLADLSNPAKEFFDALNWGKRVVSEFFEQGDVEKAFGSENVNKVFDREAGRLEDIQIGFIQHLVVPLFVEWCEFCEDDLLMKLIYANLEVYQSR